MTDHQTLTKNRSGRGHTELSENDQMMKYYLVTGYIENNFPGNSSYHVNTIFRQLLFYFISEKVFTLYIVINPTCFYSTAEFRFLGSI